MSDVSGLRLVSTLHDDGRLVLELEEKALPAPTGKGVLVKVDATPVNPSDLGVMFGAADLASAEFAPGRIVARLGKRALAHWAARIGEPIPVGNEGTGMVVAAGEDPMAQALLGKRVAGLGGGMYAQYRLLDARACMELPEGTSREQGASCFVNPMTALCFVECMRMEGHSALIHTAAASNLGQMLVRICAEDGVPLVNVVRSPAQVELLKGIGAENVVDSTAPGFLTELEAAIERTEARMAFDAIGGGGMAGTLLAAMERVCSRGKPWNVYGSADDKRVYVYGMLDPGATSFQRGEIGFGFTIAGFLLTFFLPRLSREAMAAMHQRIRDGLTTTFASHYTAGVGLEQMLERDTITAIMAKRTGEKYLVLPNG